MLNSGVQGSRKLFWRNVQQECERLCQIVGVFTQIVRKQLTSFPKVLNLNQWELLAAVQALAVYLIVRVSEGETEYNNFDSILQTTVLVSKYFVLAP
jgi:hypothetical protein